MESSAATTDTQSSTNLRSRFDRVRKFTQDLASPLSAEDCALQSMPDASPTKWHMAHTTWFFETFLLADRPNYEPFHPEFTFLFNSYYNTVGDQFPRPQRGLLSRPTLDQVVAYREHVDQAVNQLLSEEDALTDQQRTLIELGLQHEQQHQELILTDVKNGLACNPLLPVYRPGTFENGANADQPSNSWRHFPAGLRAIGYDGDEFHFDNEAPRHQVYLESYEIAERLVTNGDYLEFIDAGGYQRPEFWLSLGWHTVTSEGWNAPLYWLKRKGAWHQYTLAGVLEVDPSLPVCHISYFEADAYARWAGARLPTESEWEHAAELQEPNGSFVESLWENKLALHPGAQQSRSTLTSMYGNVWQWTSSSYNSYPGYAPPEGAIGEYNGKFMCNQYVLRGGSIATSVSHIRPTYRNFFPAHSRWQFSGLRLCRS